MEPPTFMESKSIVQKTLMLVKDFRNPERHFQIAGTSLELLLPPVIGNGFRELG